MRHFELLEPRYVLDGSPVLVEGYSSTEYTSGSLLIGTDTPNAAFDGAWLGTGTARINSGGLSYSGFGETGGNHVNLESSMVVSRLLETGTTAPLVNYVDGNGNIGISQNGQPLYLSFLMQVTGSSPPAATFSLYDNGTASSDREFRIAYSSSSSTFDAIAGPSGSAAHLKSLNGEVNLFVVRIDFQSGNDTITFWQNPTAGSPEPAFDAQITGYNIAFDRIAFSRFSGTGAVEFDEVRMGDEWSAVTSSMAIGLLPRPPISLEGFGADYTVGDSVEGVYPFVTGFDGAWSTLESNSIVSGSLVYNNFGDAGANHLELTGTDLVTREFLSSNRAALANYFDSEGRIGASSDGSPLYFSFLMQVNGASAPSATFSFYDGSIQSQDRQFRVLYAPSNATFQAIAGAEGTVANLGSLNSSVNLFVVRIDFAAGNDSISIWQNPTAGDDESLPDAQIVDYDIAFDRLAFTRFAGTGSVRFDELRIANQWFGVTNQQAIALLPDPKALFAMQGYPPSPLGNGTYPSGFFPFFDQFGQYRYSEWTEKINSVDELVQAGIDEATSLAANPGPSEFDQYGGWLAGPLLEATGYFRTAKVDGKWWLVDPDGRLFFSNGITGVSDADRDASTQVAVKTGVSGREDYFSHLPLPGDPTSQFLVTETSTVTSGDYQGSRPVTMNFYAANAFEKYGEDWEAASQDIAHDRLRSWGMNTIAAWSDEEVYLQQRTPYTIVLFPANPSLINAEGKFPDYFDPAYQANLTNRLQQEIGKSLDDPWNIGYFVNNELDWTRFTLTSDTEVGLATLAASSTQFAKVEFREQLITKYITIGALNAAWQTNYTSWNDFLVRRDVVPNLAGANSDLVSFDASYADQFFRINQETIDNVASNHLYLGSRFTGSVRFSAAQAAMAHADVVSINRYGPDISVLPAGLVGDVPLISGEYHFSADDTGLWSDGLKTAADQADRADKFSTYLLSALASDRYVGVHWLQYWDFPSAGKLNSNNNNSNLGFVTIADQPYEEMVDAARTIGDSLYVTRFGSTYSTLPGDYNLDRVVDTADYQVWKAYFGTTNPLADGNGNGHVDLADYTIWRDNLGISLPPLQLESLAALTVVREASSPPAETNTTFSTEWPLEVSVRTPSESTSPKLQSYDGSTDNLSWFDVTVADHPLLVPLARRSSSTDATRSETLDEAFASLPKTAELDLDWDLFHSF